MNDNVTQPLFAVGDVVYLKCGSCAMVVEAVQPRSGTAPPWRDAPISDFRYPMHLAKL